MLAKTFYLILFCVFSSYLHSMEIRVCKDCQYRNIKDAIYGAKARDIILIESGIYQEGQITIEKPLTIRGTKGTIIDGNYEKHVFDVKSNFVTIQKLTIINSGLSDLYEYAGIHAENVNGCIFEDNVFKNNAYAVYLAQVNDCIIQANTSVGNAENEVSGGNGIHLWSSSKVRILNNKLSRHRDGIYLEFSKDLEILDNQSYDNIRYGMHFMFSNENQFLGNSFENNSAGVAVMYSKRLYVKNNQFRDNWGESSNGLLIKDISDSIFINNEFKNNTVAIFADGSNNNIFFDNHFFNNGWGIKILGNSDYNRLKRNNFIENIFDVSTNSKSTTNIFLDNFWEKYKGYDLNRDGHGDVPHKPIHFFGYWVAVYPFLMILYESPVVLFLQGIEAAFPIITPVDYEDKFPSMKEINVTN
jgi:nitrous oxidase accessory protein